MFSHRLSHCTGCPRMACKPGQLLVAESLSNTCAGKSAPYTVKECTCSEIKRRKVHIKWNLDRICYPVPSLALVGNTNGGLGGWSFSREPLKQASSQVVHAFKCIAAALVFSASVAFCRLLSELPVTGLPPPSHSCFPESHFTAQIPSGLATNLRAPNGLQQICTSSPWLSGLSMLVLYGDTLYVCDEYEWVELELWGARQTQFLHAAHVVVTRAAEEEDECGEVGCQQISQTNCYFQKQ